MQNTTLNFKRNTKNNDQKYHKLVFDNKKKSQNCFRSWPTAHGNAPNAHGNALNVHAYYDKRES